MAILLQLLEGRGELGVEGGERGGEARGVSITEKRPRKGGFNNNKAGA